jgi:hypothetical protein
MYLFYPDSFCSIYFNICVRDNKNEDKKIKQICTHMWQGIMYFINHLDLQNT